MDDYYALLGVERTAPVKDLEKQIRTQLRTWSKRSNHPDLSRRQEAERRVQQLGEARKILLDADRRAEYDRGLALAPASASTSREPATGKPAGVGWLDEARRHIVAGDYFSASYAARQARDADPGDPETWSILAWVNAETGNLRDALFEAGRAVELDPRDASRHLDLGDVQARTQLADAALASYRRALELDPELEEAVVGIAGIVQDAGRHADALRLLEDLLPRSRDPEWLGNQLGIALLTAAEAVPRAQWADGYTVTSPAEVNFMREHVDRAREVTRDPGLLAVAADIERSLDWCTERHWRTPGCMGNGCLIAIGTVGLIVAGIVSLGVLASGDILGIFVLLILWAIGVGAVAAITYLSGFQPGWKINQIAHFQQNRYLGPW
ncbi:tetratricopeptide repeat protein [Actinomadura sp. 9N215]|uniref:J domain-containing protein n=1 Tax=Actinomadura sp. 9N215 TaxID=3375150 RepID=UPI0037A470A7